MKSDDFLSVFFCVQFGGEANENGSTYYRNRRKARKKNMILEIPMSFVNAWKLKFIFIIWRKS